MSGQTFRENYEILQRHAQTLRDQGLLYFSGKMVRFNAEKLYKSIAYESH